MIFTEKSLNSLNLFWIFYLILDTTKKSSPLSVSSRAAIGLTLVIAFILLASNFVIISAQQQQLTSQPGRVSNGISPATPQAPVTLPTGTIFQSTNDSFSIQVPQGWQIQDLNNSGSIFSQEVARGYGILGQLCMEEEQQQPPTLTNASNIDGCIGAQEVIHIVRYPNLDSGVIQTANNVTSTTSGASFNSNNNQTTAASAAAAPTTTIDNILAYHLQKLQQVGYNSIQIVNTADTGVNLTMAQSNQTLTTLPAKFGEIVYTTASAPGEIKRGYYLLTATNATSPNLGTTKGYSVFYEGSMLAPTEITATSSGLSSVPPLLGQVFDSFMLIVAPELELALTRQPTVGQPIAGGDTSCHPSYPDDCIPAPPPQLNCDSPGVPTNFRVVGSDPHGFIPCAFVASTLHHIDRKSRMYN